MLQDAWGTGPQRLLRRSLGPGRTSHLHSASSPTKPASLACKPQTCASPCKIGFSSKGPSLRQPQSHPLDPKPRMCWQGILQIETTTSGTKSHEVLKPGAPWQNCGFASLGFPLRGHGLVLQGLAFMMSWGSEIEFRVYSVVFGKCALRLAKPAF